MKRLVLFLVLASILITSQAWAIGSCVMTAQERVAIDGRNQRTYLTLTCTGDAGGITAYSLDPATYGVRGWYLYNVTTDPGTPAPTAAYDITLVVNGEDIAGSKLIDRSSTATETVAIAPTTPGYHMMDSAMVITFANETDAGAIIVIKFRFTSN